MQQYIIVGQSNIEGYLLVPYEEARACNFCENFRGYRFHACEGYCFSKNKDIPRGYDIPGGYREEAKNCNSFRCTIQNLATIVHETVPMFEKGNVIKYVGPRKDLAPGKYTIERVEKTYYECENKVKIPFRYQEYYKLVK